MLTYAIRRVILAIPTLLFIALVIFALLEFAPGDPTAQIPLTVPPEVKAQMREALGLGEPSHIRFGLWLWQFFIIEPLVWIDHALGTAWSEG
ncbi:MAG: ABC transporter permease, partial [Pseudomonadota bacterium]